MANISAITNLIISLKTFSTDGTAHYSAPAA